MSPESPLVDNTSGAVLDDSRTYRYRLWRLWDAQRPTVGFVMLNPSTADETDDDATIRRCIGYAMDWGYGKLVVGNLFALRTKDPANLSEHPDPVGPENDRHLEAIAADADRVVAAWGATPFARGRDERVAALLDGELFALDTTKDGHPAHPVRKSADLEPQPWEREKA